MWSNTCARVCRNHPDVITVYRSPYGKIALLLRQTLVPLPEERVAWLNDTRRVARAAIAELRRAGLRGSVTVVQWRSPEDAAHILRSWTRCYEADADRRDQLTDIARLRLADLRASGPRPGMPDGRSAAPGRAVVPPTFIEWYRGMAPSWLGAMPATRRRLILCAHRWIAERVLGAMSRGEAPHAEELGPTGRLAWALAQTLAADELAVWRPWIRLVVGDLQRALAWPAARRNEAWVRWLFLIPYSVPVAARGVDGRGPGVDDRSGLLSGNGQPAPAPRPPARRRRRPGRSRRSPRR